MSHTPTRRSVARLLSQRSVRLALVGAIATCAVTLAGCSGGSTDADADAPAPASASAPASSGPASAPSSSGSASRDDSGSDDSGSDPAGSDESGKPTMEEVSAGLVKWYQDELSIPKASATTAADCLAKKIYKEMSVKALRSIADGKLDPTAMSSDDAQAFADASSACVSEIGAGH